MDLSVATTGLPADNRGGDTLHWPIWRSIRVVSDINPGLMMSTGFRCKQFYVDHGDCAMKVGTDALLLGAWTALPASGSILDIGCGSGILALMLAQRTAADPAIAVDAIELDPAAAAAAAQNFRQSSWDQRIRLIKGDILTYPGSADHPSGRRYALIVSNPPFFVAALKSANEQRRQARHTDSLSFAGLLQSAALLLADQGRFSLVLPCAEAELLLAEALGTGWVLVADCLVQTTAHKPPSRRLMTLARPAVARPAVQLTATPAPPVTRLLIHQTSAALPGAGAYSPAYRALLRDFYLKF